MLTYIKNIIVTNVYTKKLQVNVRWVKAGVSGTSHYSGKVYNPSGIPGNLRRMMRQQWRCRTSGRAEVRGQLVEDYREKLCPEGKMQLREDEAM